MRILIITNLFPTEKTPWGGAFVWSRVAAMQSAGHEVDVVALQPRKPRMLGWLAAISQLASPPRRVETSTLMKVADVPMSSFEYLWMWSGRYPPRAVQRAARRVADLVNPADYDAVMAQGMYAVPAGSVAHKLAGSAKFTVICHGSDVNMLMPRRADDYVRTFADARAAVFVSSALLATARRLGLPDDKGIVIPNGVDTEHFTPNRREQGRKRFGWEPETQVVSFVGNLVDVKGADRIPQLVRDLKNRTPEVVMAVAGDGPLGSLLAESGQERVQRLGRLDRDAVADLMAATDVLVLPSRSEGWPSVILEAFASGTAVVGTDVGGIREALGGFGAVVGPDDEGLSLRMAQAVTNLLESPDASQELRERALAYAWDVTVAHELHEASGAPC